MCSSDPKIHLLQPDQSLPDDSALMDDKHTKSSNCLSEYGIFGNSVTNRNSGDDSGKEGNRHPKSNMEIQGNAIRSSRLDV